MNVIQDQEITGQSFILEEVSFINCKLKGVTCSTPVETSTG